MSKINLEKLPKMQSSIKDIARFRGATSSHNYNELQENMFFDISNMFNIMSEFENRLQETSELQVVDNLYTQMKLKEVEAENEVLRAKLNTLIYKEHRRIYIDAFNAEPVEVATSPIISKQFNQINLRNHSATSKLFLYDEGLDLVTIPSSLKYELYPAANGSIVDNDLRLAFNGNINEFFVRKIVSDDPTAKELEIVIELPDNIISSRNINSIELSPYPYGSVDILDIEYQLNGNWTRVPGFTSHKDYIAKTELLEFGDLVDKGFIKDAENIKLCFDKVAMARIRFRLRQRTYIVENNKCIFYFGIKTLNVNYESVANNYCEFSSDIIFEEDEPKLITSIVPYFNNDRILSDQTNDKKTLMSYEFYEVDEEGAIEYLKSSLPLAVHNKHYRIITKMYYDRLNDINPSLRGLNVNYELTEKVEEEECTCIIKNVSMNLDDTISIPFNKSAAISMLDASADVINDCVAHADSNATPLYKYKIKTSTSDCYIEDGRIIAKTEGQIIITVEVHYNGKIVKKDFTYKVIKEDAPILDLNYTANVDRGKIAGATVQKVKYGKDASMVEAIANKHYTFTQWSDGVDAAKRTDTNVVADIDVEALFDPTRYRVTFMAFKNTNVLEVIDTQDVEYNTDAVEPNVPQIDGYRFLGWDSSLKAISEPKTITAQYARTYVVTFVDYNGATIDKQLVETGGDAIAPHNPHRPGYTFTGWNKPLTGITEDTVITAVYEAIIYIVTFKGDDDAILKEEEVLYKNAATAPTPPVVEGKTFTNWDKDFSSVVSDMTVKALYGVNIYTARFLDESGNVISQSKVEHGSIATPPNAPDKEGHKFEGWERV